MTCPTYSQEGNLNKTLASLLLVLEQAKLIEQMLKCQKKKKKKTKPTVIFTDCYTRNTDVNIQDNGFNKDERSKTNG